MPQPFKHIIQCRCILPQFKNKKNVLFHKFIAFSVLEDDDTVKETFINCNNCGVVHKIVDLCKTEIQENSDDWQTIKKEDLRISLPEDVLSVLDSYDCDLATFQHALWIIENEKWGERIIVDKNESEERIEGKYLIFNGNQKYRIETFYESKNV